MSAVLRTIKDGIQCIFDDSLSWFDTGPYIVDWIVVIALVALERFIGALPVFEREFSPNDPLIQHPHTSEQISSLTNTLITVAVPVLLVVVIGWYRSSVHEIYHGLLATFAGMSLSRLITEALKNRVGRLRPDFLARCQWDASQHVCTGDPEKILDGRRSFPSGHSTTAFASMIFVSLFLAGKTAALCFSVTPSFVFFLRSRLVRLGMVLMPLVFAGWVAVTRIEDYRHYKEDVIAGGVIGIFSGTICYLLYWPNPFSANSFSAETMGCARLPNGVGSRRNGGYRLAPEDPEPEPV